MEVITFVVGEGLIRKSFLAHRLVVSGSSPVFNRLCFGIPVEGEIVLPNVDPDDFRLLLNHIYGKETVIESVQQAWNLLPTAKKYGLSNLQDICRFYILNSVDLRNACSIYEEAVCQEEGTLILESFKFIVINAKRIFWENGLIGAHSNTVAAIVRQECIDVESEYQLFAAILEWAKLECAVRKHPITPSNLREILDPLLPYIRFLRMRTFEFMKGPASSGILTKEEIMDVLLNIFAIGSSKLPSWCSANTEMRHPNSGFKQLAWNNICVCLGYEEESCKEVNTIFKNKDKAIFIVGIGIRLTLIRLPIVQWFSANISVKTNEKVETVKFEIEKFPVIGEQIVVFEYPVFIKSDETFQISITVDDLSPHVHCCRLKPRNETGPFSVVREDEVKVISDRDPLYRPTTTCFSTIRYLSIT